MQPHDHGPVLSLGRSCRLEEAFSDSECCPNISFNLLDQGETRKEIPVSVALFEDVDDSLDVAEVLDRCVR